MSRRAVAAIALAVLAAAGPAAHVSARSRPALRFVTLSPVSVHGSGFGARERVRMRLQAHDTLIAIRHVRTTRRGGFTVRFAGVLIDRCSAFSVTAVTLTSFSPRAGSSASAGVNHSSSTVSVSSWRAVCPGGKVVTKKRVSKIFGMPLGVIQWL